MNFRTQAPQRQTLQNFKLPHFKARQLQNEQTLYYLPYGKEDMLFLKLIFEAGTWYETEKYSAIFLADMFLEGTDTKNHHAIRELFDQYGATCRVRANKHTFTVELCCLNRHLDPLLDQIVDLNSNCNFPVQNWEKQKRIKLDNLKYQEEKTAYLARREFSKVLYTNQHPYHTFYTAQSLENFDLEYVEKHYQNQIKTVPFQIILAGGITAENLESVVKTLGRLDVFKKVSPSKYSIQNQLENQTIYSEKERALQTSIMMGKFLEPMSKSEEAVFKMLTTVLGGYFGSRLMSNLREDKGYTYGVYCQTNLFLKARSLVIGGDFIKAKRREVISEIEYEIERLKTEPLDNEELDRVKNYMAGKYLKSFNTPENLTNHLSYCLLFGLEQNYRDSHISDLQNITAQNIQTVAQKYLSGNWLKVMVG